MNRSATECGHVNSGNNPEAGSWKARWQRKYGSNDIRLACCPSPPHRMDFA